MKAFVLPQSPRKSLSSLFSGRARGQSLLEVIIALALVGIAIPAVLTAFSTMLKSTAHLTDHAQRLELAQSQMEYIQAQEYMASAQDYFLINAPDGYSIEITSSVISSYRYPDGRQAPGGVQQIDITVTGHYGATELEGYKIG